MEIKIVTEMYENDGFDIQTRETVKRKRSRLSESLEGTGSHDISLSWRNISVSVKVPGKRAICSGESVPPQEKCILKNISGTAPPGSLLAVMGASGSGKSTLLNVLTSRNTRDYTTSGEVLLNGVPIGGGIRNVSAYVQQSDLFFHTLTVREQLQFRALLRMDKKLDKAHRLSRVEEVICEMGLYGVADSRIGAPTGSRKGISGGERKRLSFASELLTNPHIFFCDEPTSSLDTFMAQSIVHSLRDMAAKGRCIICTIHQPSSELFAMFNQILLLSEGRIAFMGSSTEAMDFFKKMNYPCPQNFNPGDHYILTLAVVPGREEECRQRTGAICDAFIKTDGAHKIETEIDKLCRTAEANDRLLLDEITGDSRYTSSIIIQLSMLFWRSWTAQFRDVMLFSTRVIQTLVVALILGLIYLDLDTDQKGVMNINGALFLLIVQMSFTNMFSVLTSFPEEMGIVMREYGSGLYRIDTYFITKVISELPVFIFLTVIFSAITYWMMGLKNTFEAFCVCCIVLLLVTIVTVGVGTLISVAAGDSTLALSIAGPVVTPVMLFGGLFLNQDDVPDYFKWLEALSWYKYGNEIFMVSQWDGVGSIECENRNATLTPDMSIEQMCRARACLFRDGEDVLNYNGMHKSDVAIDYMILCVLAVSFYFLAFIGLLIRARRSKE